MQSPLVTTDKGHTGLGLTEGTFYYSLAGGAQGWRGTNQVIAWDWVGGVEMGDSGAES